MLNFLSFGGLESLGTLEVSRSAEKNGVRFEVLTTRKLKQTPDRCCSFGSVYLVPPNLLLSTRTMFTTSSDFETDNLIWQ